jgi:SAM-dependent methyltransferase
MNTKQHITSLKNFLPNINSILEIQCGGGYDIENCLALQDKNLNYIGVDVVDEHILDNRQYFRNEKNKIFMVLDASNEPLPKTDLVVCVGMVEYLPIANIWSLLENIRDSEAKYFAFDFYHVGEEMNSDIKLPEDGEDKNSKPKKRAINLCQAPFYFPKPKHLFLTDDIAHSVALYEISDVSFFMDWHNDDVSKLRMQLVNRMEEDMSFLKPSFLQEVNGEEIFKEMMLKFLELGTVDHHQKYYHYEPYKTIIDRVGGLTARNNIFFLASRSEMDRLSGYDFVNADNFIHAQILAKDFIRWKFGLSLWID